jgi:AraC family transcriptional activator of pyochelin receptor
MIENKAIGNILPEMLYVSPRMKIIIKEIINYNSANEIICRNFIRNKAMEIIHLQLEQIIAQKGIQERSDLNLIDKVKIQEAQKILEANFRIPPTIRQLSLMLATNEFKLKSGFNQLYRTSMHQYVIALRIEKAIELMYTENVSLERISDMVGYATLSSFTRAFKKVKGVSPNAFRTSK